MKTYLSAVLSCLPFIFLAQVPELVLPRVQGSSITFVSLSSDGRYTASSSYEEVSIWETESGRLIRSIKTGELVQAAFSPDNRVLLTGTGRRMFDDPTGEPTLIKLWDCSTGMEIKKIGTFAINSDLSKIEFSKNSPYFLATVQGKTYVWHYPDGTLVRDSLDGYGSFSADGNEVFLEQRFNATARVNIQSGEMTVVRSPTENNAPAVLDRIYHPAEILTLYETGLVQRWSILGKQQIGEVILDRTSLEDTSVKGGGFSGDGSRVGLYLDLELRENEYEENPTIGYYVIWDTRTGKQLSKAPCYALEALGGLGSISNFWGSFTPDLKYFITIPVTDVADPRAGIQAVNTATGTLSFNFGVKQLEWSVYKNQQLCCTEDDIAQLAGVYNGGECLMVHFSEGTTIFYPQSGKRIAFSGNLPADNLFIRDDKWVIGLEDGLVYTIKEKASGKIMARLLFSDESYELPSYEEAIQKPLETSWAATTPSGLFDASPDMMGKLHFVVGMETIGLEQLKARYHEPGLMPILLGASRGEVRNVSGLRLNALFPVIEAAVENGYLNVKLSPREGGIGAVRVAINGKTVLEDANPERKTKFSVDLKPFDKFCLPETRTVSLIAANAEGWLESAPYTVNYGPSSFSGGASGNNNSNIRPLGSNKPSLYILCIGTSKYRGGVKPLTYPDLDAEAMFKALTIVGRALFNDRVEARLLSTADNQPLGLVSNKQNIAAAFKAYADKANCEDILVVYFSGHGQTYGEGTENMFYYLTKDVTDPDLKDPEIRKNYGISTAELTQWLTANPAMKQVLIFDACHSGKAAESLSTVGARALNPSQIRALDRMKDRTGTFILSGSAANDLSYEASEFGQGLLTYSLLEGMNGAGLKGRDVDVMTLFQHARDRVPDLAKRIREVQVPVMAFPIGGGSFEIGIKNPGDSIPVAQTKPVFIRSEFQDEELFKDKIGLGDALAEKFQAITLRGAQASMIYLDTKNYDNAYAVHGRYEIAPDGAVSVTCRLFKDATPLSKFVVSGQQDNVPAIAQAIMAELPKYLPK